MDGTIVISTEIDTKDFDAQMKYIEGRMYDIEGKLKDADLGLEVGDTQKLEAEYEKLGNQLIGLREKQEKYNQSVEEVRNIGFDKIKSSIDSIGGSIQKTIKKVIRWGLAIFGIRSAYLAIRQAASTLSSYNEQIGADLQYIRFALATALQPIVETIINLVYKLLGIINAISVKLFGYNLFAKATAEAFNRTAKSAEKLKKSLAGFDEMNVLQDTSGDETGGGTPSMDLSKVDEETGAYVEKMAETAKTVTSFWEEEWKTYFENAQGNWATLWQGYLLSMEGFYKTFKGIWELIGGVIDVFVGIFTGDVEKIREGWEKMCQGLADIITGIIYMIIGSIIWFIGIILGLLRSLWDGIVNLFIGVGDWTYNYVIKPVVDLFTGLWNTLKRGAADAWNGIKNIFGSVANFFGNVFGSAWERVKAVFSTGGKIFMGIVDGILEGFKKIVNAIITGINKVIAIPFKGINGVLKTLKKIDILGVKPFGWIGTIDIPKIPKLAKGGIINQPGRGIPVGGAIAGERGREGVIPLTDSQQMALLGEAIGKYITINANITNTMNGRVISRELQKIQTDNNFAYNR